MQEAVPFVSDRRGFNCVKFTAIVREVLGNSSREKAVLDNLKGKNLNDNHLYRLRESKCHQEIIGLFQVAFINPASNIVSASAASFRLKIIDRIASNCIQPPLQGSPADYAEAATWVEQQPTKFGKLKQAVSDWLTHRNVELKWWKLQKCCNIPDQATEVVYRGQHMSDMVFFKYVVPVMHSTGHLKHSVEKWMDVMCAVDMLQRGMVNVDGSGNVDRDDDGVINAVWRGALPASGKHANQPRNYKPFPKDRSTAVKFLNRHNISTRTGEMLGAHRLAADPHQVQSVFDTLRTRMREHNVTSLRNVLVTDEFRLKKEMERVFAAIEAVAMSEEQRAFMSGLEKVVDGATIAPVSTILGDTLMIQVVCREGDRKTNADDIKQLFRAAGFTCPVLVCYSETGYQSGETNQMLKDVLIDTLGAKWFGWTSGEPLPEAYILIEDGASMHCAGDIAHALKCLTSGLVVHHVAANSTHFSQLYDRLVYLIAKMLSIKELSIRIQAMSERQRPNNAISKAAWCLRVMNNCVDAMTTFENPDSTLQDARNSFMRAFMNNRDAEVKAMEAKLDDIFTMAQRGRVDELMLLSAIAPAMAVALQPKYVVRSAIMVGLLPPDFVLGRDDTIQAGVWPDHVMKNPLVQLQLKRRENERNFANHQEIAIRGVLAGVGIEEDQQRLSAIPPLSSAGEKAALDAAGDTVFAAYKRSRGLENEDEEFLKRLQVRVGDFALFRHQVEREMSRAAALSGLVAFNSRTAAACHALLSKEKEAQASASLALIQRALKFGASKFNAVILKLDAANRHSTLFGKATSSKAQAFHSSNLDKCFSNATEEFNAGCSYYKTVDEALPNLQSMHYDVPDDINEARAGIRSISQAHHDFSELHKLGTRAHEALENIQEIIDQVTEGHAAIVVVARDAEGIDNAVAAEVAVAPEDAAEVAPAPEVANLDAHAPAPVQRRQQRRCKTCKNLGHQSNSSKCPGPPQQDFDL